MTVPAPGSISPSYSTVNTNLPTCLANLTANAGRKVRAEWQFATDSAFTSNVRTITEPTSKLDTGGTHSMAVDLANALFQTVWWIRCRAYDDLGATSAWVAGPSFHPYHFQVFHPPTALGVGPNSPHSVFLTPQPFNWIFQDTSPDVTSGIAYDLYVYDAGTMSLLYHSGFQSSTDPFGFVTISGADEGRAMAWAVVLRDSDGLDGDISTVVPFTPWTRPTVTITAPTAGGTVGSSIPTITWNFSASGGRTQAQYRVRIHNNTDGGWIYDSDWILSAVHAHTPSTPILHNGKHYNIEVLVKDTFNIQGFDEILDVTATWTPPAAPSFTISTTHFVSDGYVEIDWTDAAIAAGFISWRVYYRKNATAPWTLIDEETVDHPTYAFLDYLGAQGDYVVVQLATVMGDPVESSYAGFQTVTLPGADYWLIPAQTVSGVVTAISGSMVMLTQVTADAPGDEWENETMLLIGRGRRTEYGTHYGKNGELTAEMWPDANSTARQKRQEIEDLKELVIENDYDLYLRNPFGDLWKVSVGDFGFDRTAGVGVEEMGNLTVPYQEVV